MQIVLIYIHMVQMLNDAVMDPVQLLITVVSNNSHVAHQSDLHAQISTMH